MLLSPTYYVCLFSDPKSSILMNQPPSSHVVKTVGYLSVSGSQGKNFFDLVMRNVEYLVWFFQLNKYSTLVMDDMPEALIIAHF